MFPLLLRVNRFGDDENEDLRAIADFCYKLGVECAITEVFNKGGEGALELAGKIIRCCRKSRSEYR